MHRFYRETSAAFKINAREFVERARFLWRWGYIVVSKAGVIVDGDIFSVRLADAGDMQIQKETVAHLVMAVVFPERLIGRVFRVSGCGHSPLY